MSAEPRRILVVDDDPALLRLMTAYLTRMGYQVDACQTAEEGWELVQANNSSYSLALVDVRLPGLGGRELAVRIRASNDEIRLVVVSGYPAERSGIETLGTDRISFLQKPFTPAALLQAIRQPFTEHLSIVAV